MREQLGPIREAKTSCWVPAFDRFEALTITCLLEGVGPSGDVDECIGVFSMYFIEQWVHVAKWLHALVGPNVVHRRDEASQQ